MSVYPAAIARGVDAARAAAHHLEPGEARALALDLLTLRVALRHGIFTPDRERKLARFFTGPEPGAVDEALALLPRRLTFASSLEATGAALREIRAIEPEALQPRLPGELYEVLLETPLQARGSRRNLREQRMRAGSFFTPAAIVAQVIDMAVPRMPPDLDVCDPAAGSGHFLLGLVGRYAKRYGDEAACAWAADHLYGLDRDSVAVTLARRALWLALSRPEQPFVPGDRVRQGDTLLDEAPATFDAVVGNPPYDVLTRFGKHPAAKRYAEALRGSGRYPLSCSGQLNLYRCFIERGLQLLRPGGRLAFVVPGSLLTDRCATPLRQALLATHGLDRIRYYHESERVFAHASQSVVVFRARRDAGKAARLTVIEKRRRLELPAARIAALGPEMPIPLAGEADWALLDWLAENAPRRFDEMAVGYVGEVDQTVYRRHMKDRDTGTLLLRGSHLRPFAPDLEARAEGERFLDRDGFLAQKGRSATSCLARIAPRVAQLGIRNMETRPRLVAAAIPANVFAGNSVNVWLPRAGVGLGLLCGLLNSRLYDWRFRLTSSNHNINLCEIQTLPLPEALEAGRVRRVEKAVAACRKAAQASRRLDKARAGLDAAVYELFGLPVRFREHLAGKPPFTSG